MLYYDITLSYVAMDDHVTVSMVTTMNSSTITGLPDDTQVNITVTAAGIKNVVYSVDSASVSTVAFESMYYMCIITSRLFHYINTRAGGIGPAALVLAGPVFSQGKNKIPFLQKASNKQSASVIFGLIRLIILSYNR